jgi:hypothetical protein
MSTMAENAAAKQRRRGRPFEPGKFGHPAGKPNGTRHRITMLAEKLMQNDTEAVVRAVVEAAKGGDMTAARLILDRIVPGFNGVCRFDAGGSERLCKRDRSEAESSRNARA